MSYREWYQTKFWLGEHPLIEEALLEILPEGINNSVGTYWHNNGWRNEFFRRYLNSSTLNKLLAVEISPNPDNINNLYWGGTTSGPFTIGFAVDFQQQSFSSAESVWRKIWKVEVMQRIRTFFWQVCHDAILSNENKVKSQIATSAARPLSLLFTFCEIARGLKKSGGN